MKTYSLLHSILYYKMEVCTCFLQIILFIFFFNFELAKGVFAIFMLKKNHINVDKFSKKVFCDKGSYLISCPEQVAVYLASLLKRYKSAVELCSGVGITVLALAKSMNKVYGIEIDRKRLEMSIHNARLYGVERKVKFILGDATNEDILKNIKAEVAILDPDWSINVAGKRLQSGRLKDTSPNTLKLFKKVKKYVTGNIVVRSSKHVNFKEFQKLGCCQIHNIIYGNRIRFKYGFYLSNKKCKK